MPSFNYIQAKSDGYTDQEISDYLDEQNNQGADLYIDKKEYQAAIALPKEKGFLDKTAELSDKTFGKVADFAFGDPAKQIVNTGIRTGEAIAAHTGDAKALEESNAKLQEQDMKAIQRARQLAAEGQTDLAQRLLKVVQSHGSPVTMEDILSNASKSSIKQVAGEAIKSAAAVAPFSKAAKGASLVTKTGQRLMKGSASGVSKKALAAEGAAYGAAFGAGDAMQEEESTVSDVAKGAVVSGAGGAIISLGIGALVPYAAKTIASGVKKVRNIVSPEVESSFMKAIKPKAKNRDFTKNLKTAIPDIYETAKLNGTDFAKSADPLSDLDKTILDSKKRVWATYKDLKDPNGTVEIDGNEIADAMVSSIDKRFRTQNPEKAAKIETIANTYRKNLTIDEAEEALQSANNDLHSYYAKNKVSQKVAAMDPETGYIVKEAQGLRNQLYNKLSELTGADAAELKRRYGALSSIQEEVQSRINVAARQAPETLAEQITYASAAADFAENVGNLKPGTAVRGAAKVGAAKMMKERATPEWLIKNAFAQLDKKPPAQYAKPPNQYERAIKNASKPQATKLLPGPTEQPQRFAPKPNTAPSVSQINLPGQGVLSGQRTLDGNGFVPGESGIQPSGSRLEFGGKMRSLTPEEQLDKSKRFKALNEEPQAQREGRYRMTNLMKEDQANRKATARTNEMIASERKLPDEQNNKPKVLYHGTSAKDFKTFSGISYFTDDPKEALGFAKGVHLGGAKGGKERVVAATYPMKKIKDIQEEVLTALEDGNLDEVIARELKLAKKEGYDTLSFSHPSTYTDGEFIAYVPVDNKQVKIKKTKKERSL